MSWCTRIAPAKRAHPPTRQAEMKSDGNLVLLHKHLQFEQSYMHTHSHKFARVAYSHGSV